ncbi:hypothetical protein SprV_0501913000 [Sparganum proliferum]
MLINAYREERRRMSTICKTDDQFSNTRYMQILTRPSKDTVQGLHSVGDCALNIESEADMQRSMDLFAVGCALFRPTINMDRTVIMQQSPPNIGYNDPRVHVNGIKLESMDKPAYTFMYVFPAMATIATTPNPTTDANTSDFPTVITATTLSISNADSILTCPHCDRTFTSGVGLESHLRIHRTEADEPVPGAQTYTRRTHLYCPNRPRTFTHRMDLFDHVRMYSSGIRHNVGIPTHNLHTQNSIMSRSDSCAFNYAATTSNSIAIAPA